MPKTKYRPSLTATQIQHLIYLAKLSLADSSLAEIHNDSISVISTLAPFAAKIENSAITPAYTTTGTARKAPLASLEALGATPSNANPDSQAYTSKEQYWEHCYTKLQANPTLCTVQEIEAAREHAYLNDLMSTEEIAAFEAEMFAAPDAIVES